MRVFYDSRRICFVLHFCPDQFRVCVNFALMTCDALRVSDRYFRLRYGLRCIDGLASAKNHAYTVPSGERM
jgi:hypothetical protein